MVELGVRSISSSSSKRQCCAGQAARLLTRAVLTAGKGEICDRAYLEMTDVLSRIRCVAPTGRASLLSDRESVMHASLEASSEVIGDV